MYTMWIRNFFGEVGPDTFFSPSILLQGKGYRKIHIGSRCSFGSHCVIGSWISHGKNERYNPEIVIGDDCSFGEFCHITAIQGVYIGNGLLTGRFVFIGDNSHGSLSWEEADIPPARRTLKSKGKIIIGKNVWIGDKATILSGVTIGDNVIIGANSVVTHDIPSNCIYGGSTAREIKKLFS